MSAGRPIVLVHGGAGFVPEERRAAHVEGVRVAATAGLARLLETGSALEAAARAVEIMEDDERFNAGYGSSLNAEGRVELDACIAEGSLRTGAVAALPPFDSPIRIALAVLREQRHVLYAGAGAAEFAIRNGFERLDESALVTERARERLAATIAGTAGEAWAGGTVGAVTCDGEGHIAAATSTGGTVGKAPGRIGDSPLYGSGTYADDATCALSATGVGEDIIRATLASRIALSMEAGRSLEAAVDAALDTFGGRFGGSGGLIAVDGAGHWVAKTNTETMSWAVAREGEDVTGGI